MKKLNVSRWHRLFKESRQEVKDVERNGRPKLTDGRLNVQIKAEELHADRGKVRNILTEDLGRRKALAKIVARILFYKQKQRVA
jgi:hypothetical protein